MIIIDHGFFDISEMDNKGLRAIGVVVGSEYVQTHQFGPINTDLEL